MKSRTSTCIIAMALFAALALPLQLAAQDVTGSGTSNFVPKWTGSISPSTTLGNSEIFQTGGMVGIHTTAPAATLTVIGPNASSSGLAAPNVLKVTGGVGGSGSFSIPIAGAGSGMQLTSGQGGEFKSTSLATGGLGAAVMITGGGGATCVRSPTFCTSETVGGHGGSITLQPGAGGIGTMAGTAGNVLLAPFGGRVGVGTASPSVELHVIGSFIATGSKSALVETASYGKRQLYAVESPENWFEDFGSALLIHGRATVKLDPIFAQTVSTDAGYYVFLTPKGDCEGLYVAIQSASSFQIREMRHGKSTIAFDYRVVAKRKGYERVRLAELKDGGDTHGGEMRLAKQ